MSLIDNFLRWAISKRNLASGGWSSFFSVGGENRTIPYNGYSALSVTPVFACVRVLAETMAGLPLNVYKKGKDGKKIVVDNMVTELLNVSPNGEITAFNFKEAMMAHLCLFGNAYAEIVFDGAGNPRQLWLLTPGRVTPFREEGNNALRYRITLPNGEQKILMPHKVLHIAGLGFDGLQGISIIEYFRKTIEVANNQQEFASRFFEHRTHLGGIIQHDGKLSEPAFNRLRKDLDDKYSGIGNAHRAMILEEGMKWTQLGIPPGDAQFIEQRNFQANDIARIFRVPPHLIGQLERATFSNIEHQSIEFIMHTILPWTLRFENTINFKLLFSKKYVKFNLNGLLRGDTISRFRAYAIGRQWGWLSANDVRELEDMNPIENGDIYLTPLNMIDVNDEPDTSSENDGVVGGIGGGLNEDTNTDTEQ